MVTKSDDDGVWKWSENISIRVEYRIGINFKLNIFT